MLVGAALPITVLACAAVVFALGGGPAVDADDDRLARATATADVLPPGAPAAETEALAARHPAADVRQNAARPASRAADAERRRRPPAVPAAPERAGPDREAVGTAADRHGARVEPAAAEKAASPKESSHGVPARPAVASSAVIDAAGSGRDGDACDSQCGEALGTAVRWAGSPAEAARRAAEQDKLVYLIHVSGNFEIPGFT